MKVVQSVFGKFHHFHLARQLHTRGMLAKIFSTYPLSKLKNQEIPLELIATFPFVHLAWFASQKFQLTRGRVGAELSWWNPLAFDAYMSTQIPECDVFVGISGSGANTGTLVQSRGGRYVCDRGSSHIRYADTILREEYARWGQEFKGVDQRHIRREEIEYDRADAVSVPSTFAVRTFLEMGVPSNKVHKISYGADISKFSKVSQPVDDKFDILFVGSVSFRKGVPYLLEAFEKFRHPNKSLTIVGSVSPDIELYLKSKSLTNVSFVGVKRTDELKKIMSESHCMVLPSVEEGLAMVQGEAMACGCPVICSENTGGDDLFENEVQGFVVPIRDSAAITDRLERLAQDRPLRERMSASALSKVASIGGWDTYGRDYVEFLHDLIGRGQCVN